MTTEWVSDASGNKCSVAYFGSVEAAKAALDSLKDCKNCVNCSRCSDCSYCSYCSRCSDCSEKTGAVLGEPWKMPEAPTIPNIHQAVYEAASQPGCLDMGAWHCGTTHCRAGWVVTLAGEAGKALEAATSTPFAAMQIYRASDPTWRMSNFFASNEEALADMKRLAEQGSANQADGGKEV